MKSPEAKKETFSAERVPRVPAIPAWVAKSNLPREVAIAEPVNDQQEKRPVPVDNQDFFNGSIDRPGEPLVRYEVSEWAAPCPKCNGLAAWWNVLGEKHCMACEPPAITVEQTAQMMQNRSFNGQSGDKLLDDKRARV